MASKNQLWQLNDANRLVLLDVQTPRATRSTAAAEMNSSASLSTNTPPTIGTSDAAIDKALASIGADGEMAVRAAEKEAAERAAEIAAKSPQERDALLEEIFGSVEDLQELVEFAAESKDLSDLDSLSPESFPGIVEQLRTPKDAGRCCKRLRGRERAAPIRPRRRDARRCYDGHARR